MHVSKVRLAKAVGILRSWARCTSVAVEEMAEQADVVPAKGFKRVDMEVAFAEAVKSMKVSPAAPDVDCLSSRAVAKVARKEARPCGKAKDGGRSPTRLVQIEADIVPTVVSVVVALEAAEQAAKEAEEAVDIQVVVVALRAHQAGAAVLTSEVVLRLSGNGGIGQGCAVLAASS